MKRFLNTWAVIISVVLFLSWIILGAAGKGHSIGANILGIITILLCLVSIFSIWQSQQKIKTDWSKFIDSTGPLLITLVLVTYFLERELRITWFPEAIVAYGTLVFAFATFQLGQTTIIENKTFREDNERLRKEEREFANLMRIRQWADDTIKWIGSMSTSEEFLINNWHEIQDEARRVIAGIPGLIADGERASGKTNELVIDARKKFMILNDSIMNMNFKNIESKFQDAIQSLNAIQKHVG